MKKIFTLILSFTFLLTLISCNEKKESIDDPKEFTTGDIVEYNGVIYEYINVRKDITSLRGKEGLEYVFEEEENYKAYYDYYYLDMSDIANQPKLREDKLVISSVEKDKNSYTFNIVNNPMYAPTSAYAFCVNSYLSLVDKFIEAFAGSFIIKGYTEDLPEDVIVPEKIYGKYVTQIGYKAFDGASMKSIKLNSKLVLVHPFAISNCEKLNNVVFENGRGVLMSMAINNCEYLRSISGISPTMDCSLYNLTRLQKLEKVSLFIGDELENPTSYGLGGLRKAFFYNCPNLEEISGVDDPDRCKIGKAFNTVYFSYSAHSIPIYVFNNYTAIIDDIVYTEPEGWNYTIMYNPDTLEAYVPFLNDGLEKKGEIIFKCSSGKETVEENENGIYINATYQDPKYNAKLLFKRK